MDEVVVRVVGWGYATTIAVFLGLFVMLLGIKLAIARYEPVTYWLTFTASAIAGTALCDFIDRDLGLGYGLGSLLLLGLLLGTLGVWYKTEGSVSVERIERPRAELFYWAAFLVANTLGTAAGDYLADDLEAGFLVGAAVFGGVLAFTLLLYLTTKVSRVALFWVAFVVTRPFGATFGDWLTKPLDRGGVALGTWGASVVFAVAMAAGIGWEIKRLRSMAAVAAGEVAGRRGGRRGTDA